MVSLLLTFTGCAWWKDLWGRRKMARGTPEALYAAGVEAYKDGRYKRAIEHFTRLKEQFPIHHLAIMAEIGIGDAYFSEGNYAEAELAYTDFLNLHPTNEHVPYVIYQLGMCHYKQMMSIDRDQTSTIRAVKEFEKLITRYPQSKFAPLAEQKLQECRRRLAEHEFYVGEFYFKQKKYRAAIKRFEYIEKNYPNLGLDYKTKTYLKEARERLAKEEAKTDKREIEKQQNEAKKEQIKESLLDRAAEDQRLKLPEDGRGRHTP
ncbi:MAG: outer membrane protein assembly factor BamD [Syntrophales bacterium]|nr:outer membrane protein assembly factor BamD [Syntrophales bacterium]